MNRLNKLFILSTIIIISCTQVFSQKTVKFVGTKYPIPSGCEKVSDYEIKCGMFEMSWLYAEKGTIEYILFEIIKKMEQNASDFKYKALRMLIDTFPASGYVTSFTLQGTKIFQFFAAGNVRGQNVLIQCMDVKPFWLYDNANPLFKQIITLLPDMNKERMEMDPDTMPKVQEFQYIDLKGKKRPESPGHE